jgi:bifunctional non-homologous end joining protein LigD
MFRQRRRNVRSDASGTADEMVDYIWLRPEIEAEIKFAEWTAGGLLRHAEFVTVREPL